MESTVRGWRPQRIEVPWPPSELLSRMPLSTTMVNTHRVSLVSPSDVALR